MEFYSSLEVLSVFYIRIEKNVISALHLTVLSRETQFSHPNTALIQHIINSDYLGRFLIISLLIIVKSFRIKYMNIRGIE